MSRKLKKVTRKSDSGSALKLDVGCGSCKKGPEWTGVDRVRFPGVDIVHDLSRPWPFKDESVDEIHCSHCIEHFDNVERVHVYNEMFRVLKKGHKATLIAPYWSSGRAYGDPTHKGNPISAFSFFYLLKSWRDVNAPHTDAKHWDKGYSCDFDATWGFALHPQIISRNQEFQQDAMQWKIEACQDVIVTLIKR